MRNLESACAVAWLFVVMIVPVGQTQAEIIFSESFDYAMTGNNCDLDGQGDWMGIGCGSSGNADVVSPGLEYTDYSSEGNTFQGKQGNGAATRSAGIAQINSLFTGDGIVYVSTLFQGVPTGSQQGIGGRMAIRQEFAFSQPNILLQNDGDGLAAGFGGSNNIAFGKHTNPVTHLLVARIQVSSSGEETLQAVLDPIISAGEPEWGDTVTFPTRMAEVSGGVFSDIYIDMSSGSRSLAQVDEIRIATTWDEVITGVPEPSSFAMLLTGLGLVARRRRLNGPAVTESIQ